MVEKLGPEGFLQLYRAEREALRTEGGRPVRELPAPPPREPRSPRPRPPGPGFEQFAATNVRPQRQAGRVAVTVRAPLGDLTSAQLRALAAAAEQFSEEGEARTTPEQNVVLRFVDRAHLGALHAALTDAGLALPGARWRQSIALSGAIIQRRLARLSPPFNPQPVKPGDDLESPSPAMWERGLL